MSCLTNLWASADVLAAWIGIGILFGVRVLETTACRISLAQAFAGNTRNGERSRAERSARLRQALGSARSCRVHVCVPTAKAISWPVTGCQGSGLPGLRRGQRAICSSRGTLIRSLPIRPSCSAVHDSSAAQERRRLCGRSFLVTACGSTVSDPHVEAFQKFHGASCEAVTLRRGGRSRRKRKKKKEKRKKKEKSIPRLLDAGSLFSLSTATHTTLRQSAPVCASLQRFWPRSSSRSAAERSTLTEAKRSVQRPIGRARSQREQREPWILALFRSVSSGMRIWVLLYFVYSRI